MGSVVAAHGLSCSAACGILVTQPGIVPASPALEGGFLTTGPPGKFPSHVFYLYILSFPFHLADSPHTFDDPWVTSHLYIGALCGVGKNASVRLQATIHLLLCQNEEGFPLGHHYPQKMPYCSPPIFLMSLEKIHLGLCLEECCVIECPSLEMWMGWVCTLVW